MKRTVTRSCHIEETARVLQMRGIFDVQPSTESIETWDVDLPAVGPGGTPIDGPHGPWSIGLVTGPSGSGKSTIGRDFFGAKMIQGFDWHPTKSVLDGFPREMGVKEVTGILSSVGFSSPPAWLRPFQVLSQGQQFRVTVARALAEMPELAVIDEWTSVVDRTVAQIGSAAVAKAVRRSGKRLVAITCHYDVADWLQPDWILDMADGSFAWRSVQPRPPIELTVKRVHPDGWHLFKKHHYLTAEMNRTARCFVAFWKGQPAVFYSVLPFPHPTRSGWRAHRMVCLPDFQGGGISTAFTDYIASLYVGSGRPFFATTGNPALIHHHARSPRWRMISQSGAEKFARSKRHNGSSQSGGRNVASFEYVGPGNLEDARAFGIA